jgi:hypothetical protein
VVNTLASFTGKGAVEEVAAYLLSKDKEGWGMPKDIMFLFQGNTSHEMIYLLRKILKDGSLDIKLQAIDRCVVTGSKEAVKDLIDALVKESPNGAIEYYLLKALRDLTGVDTNKSAKDWEAWWKKGDVKVVKEVKNDNKTGTVIDEIDLARLVPTKKLQETGMEKKILVLTSGPCKCPNNHDYDRIQDVLRKMNIPHTIITKAQLEDDNFKLAAGPNGYLALLSNCMRWKGHCICKTCKPGEFVVEGMRAFMCTGCDKHDMYEHKLSDKGVRKISDFVVGGGYLIAEDWNLEEIVIRAFPGVVMNMQGQNGKPVYGKKADVPVRPFWGNTHHPYLQKMFFKPMKQPKDGEDIHTGLVPEPEMRKIDYEWHIDDDSPIITVTDHSLVRVLLSSPTLNQNFNGNGAAALTFGVTPQGLIDPLKERDPRKMVGGRVLFTLSHFGKQKSKDDELTLHNLLINFLIEANERDQLAGAKK